MVLSIHDSHAHNRDHALLYIAWWRFPILCYIGILMIITLLRQLRHGHGTRRLAQILQQVSLSCLLPLEMSDLVYDAGFTLPEDP